MRNHILSLSPFLALSLLFTGCVENPGPRAQQGAVNGAALGAIGGAILGNNSRGGNGGGGAIVGAIAGALIGGSMGNEADQREGNVIITHEREVRTTVIVADVPQPPAKPSERIPRRPSEDAVWVSGYWIYNSNDRYEWEPGRWEIPPRGCTAYVPPHWTRQGNGYVYMRGYWRV